MQRVEEYAEIDKPHSLFVPWMVCFTASLFFFYEFIQGNMFASIADNIMRDFHIQADKMTYMSSVYYLSNVIFLFVADMMLDRFSTKKTILIFMFLCVLSTFVLASAHSFSLALLCRFIMGVGSAFCFVGPIRIASRWFPPKRMALVSGVIVTIGMAGGLLAQYPFTKLVLQVGWREALVQVGWLGVVMWFLMFFGIKEKRDSIASHATSTLNFFSMARKIYFNGQTLLVASYASLMNMAVAVFGAMMGSLYLMQRLGVSKEDGSIVNSMLFLGAIMGGPLMGWASDRYGQRVLPMKFGALLSLIVLLIILYAPITLNVMVLLFFLLGFFTSAQVIAYAFAAENSEPAMTAMAVSVVSILTQGGYILYQSLYTKLLSFHGGMHMVDGAPVYSLADYQFAAIILPLGLCLAWMALMKSKETYCHQRQDLSE